MATAFEWDDAKAARNREKHGIAFEQAVLVWEDPDLLTLTAAARPELRWMALGLTAGQLLAVVFSQPNADTIRLISARPASRKERAHYANR
jgi:uncharacterized DUF497 family protein